MSSHRIVVTPPMLAGFSHLFEPLRARGYEIWFNPGPYPVDDQTLAALVGDAPIAIIGMDLASEHVFQSCPSLRHLARNGTGVDNVDLEAAARHNVVVTAPLGANSTSVAELTFGLLLSLVRRIVPHHNLLHGGGWRREQGSELAGKTLGIIGLGRIGKKVARRAQAFELQVIAHDIAPDDAFGAAHGIPFVSFDDLLGQADIVTLHVPLTRSTHRMMRAETFAKMKPGSVLVNTARGWVVDPVALVAALDSRSLAGAALDVMADETQLDPALRGRPNVVTTPHLGAYTTEALVRTAEGAVANVLAVLDGRPPVELITAETLA